METMKSIWSNWASTINHFVSLLYGFLILYFGNSECNWGFSYEEIKNVGWTLSLIIVSIMMYCCAFFGMLDRSENGLNHSIYKMIRCNRTFICLIIIYQYMLAGEIEFSVLSCKMLIATLIYASVQMCLEKAVEKWNIGALGQLSIEVLLIIIGLLLSSLF